MNDPTRRGFLRWLVELPAVAAGVHVAACAGASSAALDSASADTDASAGAGAGSDAGSPDVAGPTAAPDVPLVGDVVAHADVPVGDATPIGDATDATDATDAADAAPEVCQPTLDDAEGPFYVPDTPTVTSLASPSEPGDLIAIVGAIVGPDCAPIPGATVEVWHADAEGQYSDAKLRATLTASKDGAYAFDSIYPGQYLQSNGWRPAHIHYKVSAPGFETLTTQLYFEGDPYLSPNDSCVSCGSWDTGRIIPLALDTQGVKRGAFEVVLATA